MSHSARLFLALVLCAQAVSSWAGERVRQFSSELLQNESQQILQPDRPFKYTDPKHGAALQKLLNPARAELVLNEYFDDTKAGNNKPDIFTQIKPLLERYENAFTSHPHEYEREYLDVLNWFSLSVVGINRISTPPSPNPSPTDKMQTAVASLQQSINGLLSSILNAKAKGLRDQIWSDMFSGDNIQRAAEMADHLNNTAHSSEPPKTREILNGQQVYEAICLICHDPGVNGAPRAGDVEAWAPRIRTGIKPLIKATLEGKGKMFPQRKQAANGYLDIEIERAVVYLANTAGASFIEPALPKGDPGTTTRQMPAPKFIPQVKRLVSYDSMDATQKMIFGEHIFEANCLICHSSKGKQTPPFTSLENSPMLLNAEATIDTVLRGKNQMPSYKQMSDDEIAAVINYARDVFTKQTEELVTPASIQNHRTLTP